MLCAPSRSTCSTSRSTSTVIGLAIGRCTNNVQLLHINVLHINVVLLLLKPVFLAINIDDIIDVKCFQNNFVL